MEFISITDFQSMENSDAFTNINSTFFVSSWCLLAMYIFTQKSKKVYIPKHWFIRSKMLAWPSATVNSSYVTRTSSSTSLASKDKSSAKQSFCCLLCFFVAAMVAW